MSCDVEQGEEKALEKAGDAPPAGIGAAAEPHAGSGEAVTVVDGSSPAGLCCHRWHDTQGTFTVGSRTYHWSSRAHRKMRFPEAKEDAGRAESHPEKFCHRFHLVCWEPKIVTWYSCWIGVIANTLWVVNGLYATWPEQAFRADPEMISYWTGVIGALLFIVTGYLGYVEALNQTYGHVQLPTTTEGETKEPRTFRRPHVLYGQWRHPLRLNTMPSMKKDDRDQIYRLMKEGYPLVRDVETKHFVSAKLLDRAIELNGEAETKKMMIGRELDVRVGNHVARVTISDLKTVDSIPDGTKEEDGETDKLLDAILFKEPVVQKHGYRWWTWSPDMHCLGIFNALVFFVATIIFFIPAAAWFPMSTKQPTLGQTIFWVYVLQIIPSIGFIYVGHAAMAEAAGSWWRPSFRSIGWWASFFNWLGGYGFLLYAVLALPAEVGDPDCCNNLTKWGASLSTFWGSCAFWVAGILECIEFSSQHPITFRK